MSTDKTLLGGVRGYVPGSCDYCAIFVAVVLLNLDSVTLVLEGSSVVKVTNRLARFEVHVLLTDYFVAVFNFKTCDLSDWRLVEVASAVVRRGWLEVNFLIFAAS